MRRDLRRRARARGRHPDAIRVLPGLSLYLGKTRREARELYQETQANQTPAAQYARIRDMLGIDLSRLPPDRPVTPQMLPASPAPPPSQTHADLLRRLIERERPTVSQLLMRPEVAGSAHWLVVGTAEDALNDIAARGGRRGGWLYRPARRIAGVAGPAIRRTDTPPGGARAVPPRL